MKWLFAFLIFLLFACNKDEFDINLSWFYHCARTQAKDSISIVNQLTGKWKWEKFRGVNDKHGSEADKDVILDFTSQRGLKVTENGNILTDGTYTLQKSDSITWHISPIPFNRYTLGTVLVCGNKVVFSNTSADGTDHQFIKQ